jgi:hypothetical protein
VSQSETWREMRLDGVVCMEDFSAFDEPLPFASALGGKVPIDQGRGGVQQGHRIVMGWCLGLIPVGEAIPDPLGDLRFPPIGAMTSY